MDFWQETNWFAVQSKPYFEDLAARNVARLDTEVFLPRTRREQLFCGSWRATTKPLFPGYFFARFCPILSYECIRYAHGVLRVVGTRQFPIPLEPDIISALKERLQVDGLIHLEQNPLRHNDKVMIEHGPFEGWVGTVLWESVDRRRVMVLLDMLEKARVVMERRYLKPAAVRP